VRGAAWLGLAVLVGAALVLSTDTSSSGNPSSGGGGSGGGKALPPLPRVDVSPSPPIDSARVANDWGAAFAQVEGWPEIRAMLEAAWDFASWCAADLQAMQEALADSPGFHPMQDGLASDGALDAMFAAGAKLENVEAVWSSNAEPSQAQIGDAGDDVASAMRDIIDSANAVAARLDAPSRDRAFERVDGTRGFGSLTLPLQHNLASIREGLAASDRAALADVLDALAMRAGGWA